MKYAFPLIFFPATGFAQIMLAGPPPTHGMMAIDWTPIVIAAVGIVLSFIGALATILINSKLADKNAAATLSNAITNSLGAMQDAINKGLETHPLQAELPGVGAPEAAGVQYVLNHAGAEAKRFGITPMAIADKIKAKSHLNYLLAESYRFD